MGDEGLQKCDANILIVLYLGKKPCFNDIFSIFAVHYMCFRLIS